MKYECYFDGSIRRNPGGDMGIGGIVYEISDGKRERVHDFHDKLAAKYFPEGTSCNIAEALALSKLLSFLIQENLNECEIVIYGDSQVVLNRAEARSKKAKGLFAPYMNEVVDVLQSFPRIRFKWIPREKNVEADAISR